jgi:hypothetical protein
MNERSTHDSGTQKAGHDPKTHDPAHETTHDAKGEKKPVLGGSGTLGETPVVRFKVDGQVKSLNRPVTGTELYRVAGNPQSVEVGGKKVKNDSEIVDIEDDEEIKVSR